MTKKHLIALADAIREHNNSMIGMEKPFEQSHLFALANFCKSENPNFNRSRWLDYIAGKCGQNGGKI